MTEEVNLDSIEKAMKLSNLCARYPGSVDVKSGRYIVCGASLLGVESLIGNKVRVEYFGDNDDVLMKRFFADLKHMF